MKQLPLYGAVLVTPIITTQIIGAPERINPGTG